MRRSSIVLPSIAVAAIAGVALALGLAFGVAGSAAASHTAASARTHCARCSIPLTINAARNPSVAGSAVRVFGRLTGPAKARKRVVLWQKLAGWRRFHVAARATTTSGGRYTIRRRPGSVETNRPGTRSPAADAARH